MPPTLSLLNTIVMSNVSKPKKTYVQAMLAIVLLNLPLCFLLWGLLLLIPIGAWQVIDAIVRTIQGDRRRTAYLLSVLTYFLLLGILTTFADEYLDGIGALIGLIGVPYVIAFWYTYISWMHAIEQDEPLEALDALIDFEADQAV